MAKAATKTVTVEQIGSPIRRISEQRQTLIGLKLNKMRRQSTLPDSMVMKLNGISDNPGSKKSRMRVGRGIGSGKGKTGGRGGKGQTARSGVAIKGFEGGQMPIYRRLPKRGFTNIFAKRFNEVNLGRIQIAIDAKKLDVSSLVTVEALVAAGVCSKLHDGVRILGSGELTAKVNFSVAGASKSAISAVEKLGGSITLLTASAETTA